MIVQNLHLSNISKNIFRKGYDGVFIKRKHVDYDEGEATFYRTKRFTCIKSQGFAAQDLIERVRKWNPRYCTFVAILLEQKQYIEKPERYYEEGNEFEDDN